MKRLTTYEDNSYMPLWQEDLKFIQDNIIQVLTQLGNIFSYSNNTFIINGCVLTDNGTQYSITEGLIMYQGELLYCPAQQVDMVSGNLPYLERQAMTDPNGSKQMILANQTTVTFESWDVNYAKLVVIDPEAGGTRLALTNALSLPERVKAQIMPDTGWMNITLLNGWTSADGVKYRKYGNLVYLRGVISGSVQTSNKFAQLPASCAPDADIVIYRGDYTLSVKKDTAEIWCNSFEDFGLSDINWIL